MLDLNDDDIIMMSDSDWGSGDDEFLVVTSKQEPKTEKVEGSGFLVSPLDSTRNHSRSTLVPLSGKSILRIESLSIRPNVLLLLFKTYLSPPTAGFLPTE